MIILDDVLPSTVFNRLVSLTVDNSNFIFGVTPTATITENHKSFASSPPVNSWQFHYFSVPLMAAMNKVYMTTSALEKVNLKDKDFYLSKIKLGEFFLTKVIFETKKFKNNIYSSGNLYNEFSDHYFETAN